MQISESAFEALVSEALDDLPDWVQERMDNVAVVVAQWPSQGQLHSARARPHTTLLGLYEGVPLPRRSRRYHLTPPDRITLFQGPLMASAQTRDELVALIRRTIIHEVAHHFGFSEDEIRHLGY